jgi:hypothetical protein
MPSVLGPLACFPLELIFETVRLPGRGISPVVKPLPTQDNTNTDETRTDIHVSSEIRTQDPTVLDLIDSMTPWTGDQPCRKAATYTGQHKHRRNADRYPCLE